MWKRLHVSNNEYWQAIEMTAISNCDNQRCFYNKHFFKWWMQPDQRMFKIRNCGASFDPLFMINMIKRCKRLKKKACNILLPLQLLGPELRYK